MTGEDTAPRRAATVILLRERAGEARLEVFLLRRHKRAGFMASSYVFPGGIAEPGDADIQTTAARELFEEAGVLLGARGAPPETLAKKRAELEADPSRFSAICDSLNAAPSAALHYFGHWITPSIEKRRYSAEFFVARLPENQTPSFDNKETVDELWVAPDDALRRSKELKLPPPQVRSLLDLLEAASQGWNAVESLAAERALHRHPILPRLAPAAGPALLLPWDPEYASAGTGAAEPMPPGHPLGVGPSRFVLTDGAWQNVAPPED